MTTEQLNAELTARLGPIDPPYATNREWCFQQIKTRRLCVTPFGGCWFVGGYSADTLEEAVCRCVVCELCDEAVDLQPVPPG